MTERDEGVPTRLVAHVFKPGDLVRHKHFGNGVVLESNLTEDDEEVTVQFETDAGPVVKRLLASFARLDAGWNDDEGVVNVSAEARRLKQELFGGDLTADDVAYVLGLDRTTVLRYLRDGDITGYQIGREWRIEPDELRAYKDRLRRDAKRTALRAEMQRQCEELQTTHVHDRWKVTVCEHCVSPVLTSRYDAERNSGVCSSCGETIYLRIDPYSPSPESATVADHSEFDNMPF